MTWYSTMYPNCSANMTVFEKREPCFEAFQNVVLLFACPVFGGKGGIAGAFWRIYVVRNGLHFSQCREGGRKVKQEKSERQKESFLLSPGVVASAAAGGYMELYGNRRAVVEGSGGVLEYDPQQIRIRAGRFCIRFSGRNLCIRCMTGNSMVIEGFIAGIEYQI